MDKVFTLNAYKPIEDDNGLVVCEDECGVSVKLHKVFCGVFSTVKKAEKRIKHVVKLCDEEMKSGWTSFKMIGFSLVENWIDDPRDEDRGWPCTFRSCRTYLGDGRLNYFSDTDDAGSKKFKGTSCPSRFKRGDFAWILCKDRMVLTLIEEESMTKEQWKKKMKRGVYGDFTDDSGIDFPSDGSGHSHTFSPLLFPLNVIDFKLPSKAEAAMLQSRNRWLKDGI